MRKNVDCHLSPSQFRFAFVFSVKERDDSLFITVHRYHSHQSQPATHSPSYERNRERDFIHQGGRFNPEPQTGYHRKWP